MRKGFAAFIAAFFLVGMGGKAQAVIGIPDDVPGSTLLFPFFKVQSQRTASDNQDTILVITNTAGTAAITHVTIWSIDSKHIFDFSVSLTPHDVFSCSLYDLLIGGGLSTTSGTVCTNSSSGVGGIAPAPAGLGTFLPAPAGSPAGLIAGYATVDVVTATTATFPGQPNYPFSYRNILVGHQYVVNLPQGSSTGFNATSLESIFQCAVDGGNHATSFALTSSGINSGGFYRTRCGEEQGGAANCAPSLVLLSCDGSSALYGDLTERFDGPNGDFAQTGTAGGFATPVGQTTDSPLNLIARYFSATNLDARSEIWLWKDRVTTISVNVALYDEEENVHSITYPLPNEVNFSPTASIITPNAPGGWFRVNFSCGQFGSCDYDYNTPVGGTIPPIQAVGYSLQFADSTPGADAAATLRWDATFPAHRQYTSYIGPE